MREFRDWEMYDMYYYGIPISRFVLDEYNYTRKRVPRFLLVLLYLDEGGAYTVPDFSEDQPACTAFLALSGQLCSFERNGSLLSLVSTAFLALSSLICSPTLAAFCLRIEPVSASCTAILALLKPFAIASVTKPQNISLFLAS